MNKFFDITDTFKKNCAEDRSRIKEYMYEAVKAIRLITSDEEYVFEFLSDAMEEHSTSIGDLSLDEFTYMLELGVNLSYDADRIFIAACSYAKSDIAKYLIDNNYVNIKSIIDNESQIISCICGNNDIVKIVLHEGISQKIIDKAMVWCKHDINKLNLLVDYGANLGILINNVVASRVHANGSRLTPLIKFILDTMKSKRLDSTYKTKSLTGLLELYISLCSDLIDLETIQMLVELGANPRDKAIFLSACQYIRDPKIVSYFIHDCHCDINMDNSLGLFQAIINDNYDIVMLLLESGITITEECLYKMYARSLAKTKYIDLLIQYGVSADKIASIIIDNSLPALKILASKGVDINTIVHS